MQPFDGIRIYGVIHLNRSKFYPEILESFTESKSKNASTNEDGYFISDSIIAIYDGATAKKEVEIDGLGSGLFIRQWLDAHLQLLHDQLTPSNVLSVLTKRLAEEWSHRAISPPYPSASIAFVFIEHLTAISCGDIKLVIDGVEKGSASKKIDIITAGARAAHWRLFGGNDERDSGREFIHPLLEQQYLLANSSQTTGFEYACLNGTNIPGHLPKHHKILRKKHIILATDGYPKVLPTLAETERHRLT